jgi:hypothetical protein
MNRLAEDLLAPPQSAFAFVFSGLARLAAGCDTLDEALRERVQSASIASGEDLLAAFSAYLYRPAEQDKALAETARLFRLEPIEVLAVRLAIAAEQDLLVGHLISHLQQPLVLSRPTIGLVAQAYAPESLHRAVQTLGQGNAVRCGLLRLGGEEAPLPERPLQIPLATALALDGMESAWPGTAPISSGPYPVTLGRSAEARAEQFARRLQIAGPIAPALVIRSGDPHEARAAADQLCSRMAQRALLVQTDQLAGMAPWLRLNGCVPVFAHWLTPGERKQIPSIPCFLGPILLLSGPEGDFDADDRTLLDWRLEIPPPEERCELWRKALVPRADSSLADRLAADHRHSAGRIAMLAGKAKEDALVRAQTGGSPEVTHEDIRMVVRRGDSVGLGALAELIPDEVDDTALVVAPVLRRELESLVVRCRLRERFPDALGSSIKARYRPAVRALFVGPSGTGKTLAVAWLATRLGIPLFRVDLSAITSKYIGETEKNLSELLARAEQSEVLLLFDEADALFGKRTDIQDSNDRFANAQTNYLLQRMESYDGITVLTSNGRSRFDDAFARRFDAIVSFPLPGPEERRDLWIAHLGESAEASTLEPGQLNRLAASAELTGGQIRNAVLRSAVAAAQHNDAISYRHLLTGVATEYRKLSRQLPNELKLAELNGAG